MNTDCTFVKGKSHVICQDYALCGKYGNFHYAMISDGCSMITNGENSIAHPCSDVASRLVCYSAKYVIEETAEWDPHHTLVSNSINFLSLLKSKLSTHGINTGIGNMIGDATLSLILASKDYVAILTIGDGTTIIEYDDSYQLYYRKYTPNMPIYLSYMTSKERSENYFKNEVQLVESNSSIDKSLSSRITYEKPQENNFNTLDNIKLFCNNNIRSISVTSDGLLDTKYTTVDGTHSYGELKTLQALLPFKSKSGVFVQRRVRGFERSLAKENAYLNDDFSMATISMDSK